MQKAPVIEGSGLEPLKLDNKTNEEAHVFGENLEERIVTENKSAASTPSPVRGVYEDEVEFDPNFEAVTGEEDEETIFQGEFKLFVWDLATSNWIEKGRGQLKLNDSIDMTENKSRLIMRVGGTLRIILNIAIRSSFRVIANSKTNIRFTDGQNVWAASGSNSNQLREFIEARIEKTAEIEEEKKKRTRHDDEGDDSVELKKKKHDDEAEEKKDDDEEHEREGDESIERKSDESQEKKSDQSQASEGGEGQESKSDESQESKSDESEGGKGGEVQERQDNGKTD